MLELFFLRGPEQRLSPVLRAVRGCGPEDELMKKRHFFYLLIALLLLLDQVTKRVILQHVALYSSLRIIPGFFNITHIHNKGAIFGAFSQTNKSLVFLLLTVASLVALALVVYYFIKTPASEWGMRLALSLILAGALGNLIDRIFKGYVIDFLDFYIKNRHWPFFNVADSCITIGAFLLLVFFLIRKPTCTPSSSA
jgi:signal peptidase II